jgi:hypothetical protein
MEISDHKEYLCDYAKRKQISPPKFRIFMDFEGDDLFFYGSVSFSKYSASIQEKSSKKFESEKKLKDYLCQLIVNFARF